MVRVLSLASRGYIQGVSRLTTRTGGNGAGPVFPAYVKRGVWSASQTS